MLGDILGYVAGLTGCFLLWTFIIYWLHRIGHISHPWNPLYELHKAHHKINYFRQDASPWPDLGQFFFWLGDWKTSLDVFLVMTVPLLGITWLWPAFGLPLLVFHYVYEVFLSEAMLDHNANIRGFTTRYFAWGNFHLYHHVDQKTNYSLMTTLWDWVFGSAVMPAREFPDHLIERARARMITKRPDIEPVPGTHVPEKRAAHAS
ncbi:MAG: sterol desaturase family protein [Spirochaetales bacterium]|nr:sterol desaturase family protein [Leptospiraceae bacterium]MCP5480247.1 sterol desaturase family protein [Spirochaetales bacterium]MCP5486354.1 sterol desaturase family protein [Spirochaetales bacterium]